MSQPTDKLYVTAKAVGKHLLVLDDDTAVQKTQVIAKELSLELPEYPLVQFLATLHSTSSSSIQANLLPLIGLTCCGLEHVLRSYIKSASRRKAPSLLRDILQHEASRQILPDVQIAYVLLGPPHSCNVRNLYWHGFCSQGCFPIAILTVLLDFLAAAIQNSRCTEIPLRNINSSCDAIARRLYTSSSCAVGDSAYSDNGWIALAAAVVEVEQELRRVFVHVNNCSERLLTAVEAEYFTTLDIILAPTFKDKPNDLYQRLPLSILMLIFDAFTCPQGPRLRDTLCHGQLATVSPNALRMLDSILNVLHGLDASSLDKDHVHDELYVYLSPWHPYSAAAQLWHSMPLSEIHQIAEPGDKVGSWHWNARLRFCQVSGDTDRQSLTQRDIYERVSDCACFLLDNDAKVLLRLVHACTRRLADNTAALDAHCVTLQQEVKDLSSRQQRQRARMHRICQHELRPWLSLVCAELGIALWTLHGDSDLVMAKPMCMRLNRKTLKARLAVLEVFDTCVCNNQLEGLLAKIDRDAGAWAQMLGL
eukprot:TRINITY_DN244_c0_g1_i1.p1 TRINITY_DN244_c0_g1~~TRINITY_DN244_c0_g1_i1.p1  ORF type:complete len:572 (+),score=71.83 TRINITY_DN244_c0_g1_i1:114-1718(+)